MKKRKKQKQKQKKKKKKGVEWSKKGWCKECENKRSWHKETCSYNPKNIILINTAKNNKKKESNRTPFKVDVTCRDCGEKCLRERIEFKRATAPRCTACGGMLDAQRIVGVRKWRTF